MPTIDDLRKELRNEQNKTKSHFEIQGIQKERENLEKQIKEERNKRKGVNALSVAKHDFKRVVEVSKPIFNKLGAMAHEARNELEKRDKEDTERIRRNKSIKNKGYSNDSFIFGGR